MNSVQVIIHLLNHRIESLESEVRFLRELKDEFVRQSRESPPERSATA